MSASLALPAVPLLPPPQTDLQPQGGVGLGGSDGGNGAAGGGSQADAFAASLSAADGQSAGHGGNAWDGVDQPTDLGSSFATKLGTLADSDNDGSRVTDAGTSINGSFSASFPAADGTEAGSNVIGRMPGIEATGPSHAANPQLQQYMDACKRIGDQFVEKTLAIQVLGGAQSIVNTAMKMQ